MVMFVNQEAMSPVQLALETARYDFACLDGLHAFSPLHPEHSWPIKTSEALTRIDAALKYLGLMETHVDQRTPSG